MTSAPAPIETMTARFSAGHSNGEFAVGIDVGGTKVSGGIVNLQT